MDQNANGLSLSVLQWNVWLMNPCENVLALINRYAPDVICLQELTVNHPRYNVDIDVPRFLADALGYHYVFINADSLDPNAVRSYGNAIFSRYPIVSSEYMHIQLPEPKDGRVYVEATIDTGRSITIGTVHASFTEQFVDTPGKHVQIDHLLSLVQRYTKRFAFFGDLNAHPGTETICRLLGWLKTAGPDHSKGTWPVEATDWGGWKSRKRQWRIDYGFVTRDVEVVSAKVLEDAGGSDHHPLLFELRFK